MLWYKEWSNSDSHPKIVAAGFWGATVFRCLCRISAEFDLDGVLVPPYCLPSLIAHRLNLAPEYDWNDEETNPETLVKRGIVSCVSSGLIEQEDETIRIAGWGDRQSSVGTVDTNSTERVRRFRESKKKQVGTPVKRVSVTYREEKIREEKKREEEALRADARPTAEVAQVGLFLEADATDAKLEQATASPEAASLPCCGKGPGSYSVTEAQIAEWSTAYPGIDVLGEVRKARAWLLANTTKRKTHSGMPRFLVSWLSRAQDSPRAGSKFTGSRRIAAEDTDWSKQPTGDMTRAF